MGLLNNRLVYLCGPIGKAKDDGQGWRDLITPTLKAKFNLVVSDPTKETISSGLGEVGKDKEYFKSLLKERKLDELKEKFWPIVHKDLRCVDRADFLIYGEPTLATVGSVHELVLAQQQKKPILMVIKEEEIDNLNPWTLTYLKKGCLFLTFEDMYKYLEEIDKGNLNNSYWSL